MEELQTVVEILHRNERGEYWIDILADRTLFGTIGPFETEAERKRATDDLLTMMLSGGATQLSKEAQ